MLCFCFCFQCSFASAVCVTGSLLRFWRALPGTCFFPTQEVAESAVMNSSSQPSLAQRACNKMTPVTLRHRHFHATMSQVACFGAGSRRQSQADVAQLDIAFRKLVRQVVGPGASMDWNRPWHEVLHTWHERVCQAGEPRP